MADTQKRSGIREMKYKDNIKVSKQDTSGYGMVILKHGHVFFDTPPRKFSICFLFLNLGRTTSIQNLG